jgi:hypothetical protein
MASRRDYRWHIVALIGISLALFLAGGVVAAQLRSSAMPEGLDAEIRTAAMIRVADIAAGGGAPAHGVFVQRTPSGLLCLSDAPSPDSTDGGGGCNDATDPLGGRAMFISFAYDGGPALGDVRDARLIGLASSDAASIEVLMSDTSRRPVRTKAAEVGGREYRAFGYRFKKADLRRGIAPTAVVALDAEGREIDRQATGFAG